VPSVRLILFTVAAAVVLSRLGLAPVFAAGVAVAAAGGAALIAFRPAVALFEAGARASEGGMRRQPGRWSDGHAGRATWITLLALFVEGFSLRSPASRARRVRMLYNVAQFAANADLVGIHHLALGAEVRAARRLAARSPDDDHVMLLAEALRIAAVCEATHRRGPWNERRARAVELVEEALAAYERVAHVPGIGPGVRLAMDLRHQLTYHP
jgi:hypothetical protein